MLLLAIVVALVLLTNPIAYQVDELKDIVLVKRFGAVNRVLYGRDPNQAGLAFKWPWPVEKTVRYSSQWQVFEDPYVQISTADKQSLLVSMYCTWRIENGQAKTFNMHFENVDAARDRIRDRLQATKNGVLGKYRMQDMINTDPRQMQLPQIEKEILAGLQREVETTYGVEVGMVRVKVWGLSEQVSQAVIETQKKEREQYVQTYKAQGEAQASTIRERAKSASSQIREFAKRKASEIENEGVQAAAALYKEFQANPELSAFLRNLESLEKSLKGRSIIMLDGSELPGVKYLREAPTLSKPASPTMTVPSAPVVGASTQPSQK